MKSIGYNPPTVENPTKNIPNTRIIRHTTDMGVGGMGTQITLEFQGPFEELEDEYELLSAAQAYMAKENLGGFAVEPPIGRIIAVDPKEEDLELSKEEEKESNATSQQPYRRIIRYRHPGI